MKIGCYREVVSMAGVTVLELSETDLPIEVVLSERIVDPAWTGLIEEVLFGDGPDDGEPGNASGVQEERALPERAAQGDLLHAGARGGQRTPAWPLRFRTGQAAGSQVRSVSGLLVASGPASLAAFLERFYEPNDPPIHLLDRLVRDLRSGSVPREEFPGQIERMFPPDEPSRSFRTMDTSLPRVGVLLEASWEHAMVATSDEEGPCYLLRMDFGEDSGTPAVVARRDRRLPGGERLPGWVFVAGSGQPGGYVAWDGRRFRVAGEFDELPGSLVGFLERDGHLVWKEPELFLPLGDLVARFVLRVPVPEEVSGLDPEKLKPTRPLLERPAVLVDGRATVNLPESADALEILDDPAEALFVLSRTTARDVFLPTIPPAGVEELGLGRDERPYRYVLGVWPS